MTEMKTKRKKKEIKPLLLGGGGSLQFLFPGVACGEN